MNRVEMMSAKDQKKGPLVPRLRFPEFRDAGKWVERKVHQIAKIYKGKGISKVDISSGGKQLCIRYGELYTSYSEVILEVISKTSLPADTLFLSKINDVIIPASGETKIDIATSSCVMKDDVALSGDLNIIRSCQNGVFISYYFNGNLKEEIAKKAQGDTVVHLYPAQIGQLDIAIPSKKEQQRIADCLSSLDERVTAETNKLDALKTHKNGLLKQLFPAEGETTPALRFPGFRDAGEWEEVPLSKLVSSLDAGVSVNAGDRPATSEEVGILKTSAVTNGVFEPQENKVVLDVVEVGRMRESVRRDTIIISRMNTPALVGANAYVDTSFENIFLPDRLWAAKPKSGTSIRFISFILGSNQGRAALALSAKGSSGSMKNITKPDVLAFLALIPSLPEQQRIADCLSSLDELITAQTQKIELLKTHKKGLMQQLFPRMDEVRA